MEETVRTYAVVREPHAARLAFGVRQRVSSAQRCTCDRSASSMSANAAGPMRRTTNMRAIPAAVKPSDAPPKNVTEFRAAIAAALVLRRH
jgi:hypothetical protein